MKAIKDGSGRGGKKIVNGWVNEMRGGRKRKVDRNSQSKRKRTEIKSWTLQTVIRKS